MLSVLILTFNEEANIAQCLASVSWADDILVVDSFSTDRTVELAFASGARVLQHQFINFAEQRNFGIRYGSLKYDWVLHLDADEGVTPELRAELLDVIRTGEYKAYRLCSKLIFQGQWLRHSSMYPCYQVRLGTKDALQFVQVGHGQQEAPSLTAIGTLKCALLHYSFSKGLEDWFAKHNRYSTAEAEHSLQAMNDGVQLRHLFSGDQTKRWRAMKDLSIRIPFRPAFKFLYTYLLRLGFLDGRAGFQYCQMLAVYEYMIVLKVHDLQQKVGNTPTSHLPEIRTPVSPAAAPSEAGAGRAFESR